MPSHRDSPFRVQSAPVRRVREVARTPNVIFEVRTDRPEVGDDRTPRTTFVVRKIDGIHGSLDARDFRNPDLLRANHVRGTVEPPRICDVTDQLPLIGIAWTGIDPDLFIITRRAAAEVR